MATIRPTASTGGMPPPSAIGWVRVSASRCACRRSSNGNARRPVAIRNGPGPGAKRGTRRWNRGARIPTKAGSAAARRWACTRMGRRRRVPSRWRGTCGSGAAIPSTIRKTTAFRAEQTSPVCCAAGPGTTIRTMRAAPAATGTIRTTATTMSAFGCCVLPRLSVPSGSRCRRAPDGSVRPTSRAAPTSGVVRRPRFAGRGEEGKMARVCPVRTVRPRPAVGRIFKNGYAGRSLLPRRTSSCRPPRARRAWAQPFSARSQPPSRRPISATMPPACSYCPLFSQRQR